MPMNASPYTNRVDASTVPIVGEAGRNDEFHGSESLGSPGGREPNSFSFTAQFRLSDKGTFVGLSWGHGVDTTIEAVLWSSRTRAVAGQW